MISHGKKPFFKKYSIELRIVDFEFLSLELVCIKFWSSLCRFRVKCYELCYQFFVALKRFMWTLKLFRHHKGV